MAMIESEPVTSSLPSAPPPPSSPPQPAATRASAPTASASAIHRYLIDPPPLPCPLAVSPVDPQAGLEVEDVDAARVDRDVDHVAVLHPRARAEPADHRRLGCPVLRRRRDGAFLPDVAAELARVLGERRGRVDLEVRDDLRAEGLAEHEDALDVSVVRHLGGQGCVLEVLRPDPENDALADVRLELGPRAQHLA